jgi:hypothetical protein
MGRLRKSLHRRLRLTIIDLSVRSLQRQERTATAAMVTLFVNLRTGFGLLQEPGR